MTACVFCKHVLEKTKLNPKPWLPTQICSMLSLIHQLDCFRQFCLQPYHSLASSSLCPLKSQPWLAPRSLQSPQKGKYGFGDGELTALLTMSAQAAAFAVPWYLGWHPQLLSSSSAPKAKQGREVYAKKVHVTLPLSDSLAALRYFSCGCRMWYFKGIKDILLQ